MTQYVVVAPCYIKPHFIESLGEEGLTAHEIAASLGVDVKHVVQKIERGWMNKIKSLKSFNSSIEEKKNINGLDVSVYCLNTRAAKAFVAQYQSEKGFAYLDFLFNCEAIVMEKLPALQKEIEALKFELGKYLKPAQKKASKKGMIIVPKYQQNVFGQLELVFVWKRDKDSTEYQRMKYKQKQISASMKGLIDALSQTNERLDRLEFTQKEALLKELLAH